MKRFVLIRHADDVQVAEHRCVVFIHSTVDRGGCDSGLSKFKLHTIAALTVGVSSIKLAWWAGVGEKMLVTALPGRSQEPSKVSAPTLFASGKLPIVRIQFRERRSGFTVTPTLLSRNDLRF